MSTLGETPKLGLLSRRTALPVLVAAGCLMALRVFAGSGDILRGGSTTSPVQGTSGSSSGSTTSASTVVLPNPTNQLAAVTQAIASVRAMQAAARALAVSGSNSLGTGLPTVPSNSYGQANGLVPAAGVPSNLSSPGPGTDPSLWTGASLPTVANSTSGGTTTQTVTIQQTSQQAVLNWQSFNIGKNTVLAFDQATFGGADVQTWIAFNKIGVVGSPAQILGSIQAAGQVYIIDPNGIIFGGSSQVNTHALVASSLPINDNLISSGLLNNPDGQFLFSGLALPAGSNGPTPAFTPLVTEVVTPSATATTFTTSLGVSGSSSVGLTYVSASNVTTALVPSTATVQGDYSVSQTGYAAATVTLTASGLAKVSGGSVNLSYTPIASAYGDVTVQPGAVLFSPTANNTGGKIALVGPDVTNQGTLSAPNGQVILAAGLQVGIAAHAQSDPSLRGLDVYVGAVSDASAPGYVAGTATNGVGTDQGGNSVMGLLETTDLAQTSSSGAVVPVDLPGDIYMTGMSVNQMGIANSLTNVSFNGRIDLLASFNAESNAYYSATTTGSNQFVYPTGTNTGVVTLGPGSFTDIQISSSTTDKIVPTYSSSLPEPQQIGTLALRSQINLQGDAIHMESSTTTATGSTSATTSFASIVAPNAVVNLDAGSWNLQQPGNVAQQNTFVATGGQVYLDPSSLIDVSGTEGAVAPVTENVVAVQLLGAPLADSPLQQTGPLVGQTVDVDLRVHGAWDAATNSYVWVGTPLADASGYIALVERTAGELTTDGGTVNINAGGSVVMQPGATVNVSGGWIAYQPGYIQTTKVVSGGQIFDISQASPNVVYSGIFTGSSSSTNAKWGVTQTSADSVQLGYQDPGYTLGGDGGKVSISAPEVALDGTFNGQTYSGPKQILTQPAAGSFGLVAAPSTFDLTFTAQYVASGNLIESYSPLPPEVIFQDGSTLASNASVPAFAVDPTGVYALPTQRQNEVDISPSLVNSDGFGFVQIDDSADNLGTSGRTVSNAAYGTILVPLGTYGGPSLTFSPSSAVGTFYSTEGGVAGNFNALTLLGANIDLEGGVKAPGSLLSFTAYDISPTLTLLDGQEINGTKYSPATAADPYRGSVTLGTYASLDVSGQVVDYRQPGTSASTFVATSGGQVSLQGYDVTLEEGSSINVSGGATVSASNAVSWGSAGSIALKAQDQELFDGAQLVLPSSYTGDPTDTFAMSGYSGGSSGGALTIQAPLIQITPTHPAASLQTSSNAELILDPELFSSGGFTKFNITGVADTSATSLAAPTSPLVSEVQGLLVGSSGVPTLVSSLLTEPASFVITPVATSYDANLEATGSSILTKYVPETGLQPGVQINLTAKGDANQGGAYIPGNLVVGSNVQIRLNPSASDAISLKGDTVAVYGAATAAAAAADYATLMAPGGTITLAGSENTAATYTDFSNPLITVYIGPNAVISTAGATVSTQNAEGYTVGSVIPGGSINVSGNIAAEAGAVLNASGASGTLYFAPNQISLATTPVGSTSGLAAFTAYTVSSNGGTISLSGGQELFSDATLRASAGGSGSIGGTLTVQSGQFQPNGGQSPSVVPSLLLLPGGTVLPLKFFANGIIPVGSAVVDANGNPVSESQSGGVELFGGEQSTTAFSKGGFDWINLNGTVEYTGAVTVEAGSGISIGNNGVIVADASKTSSLNLSAPYVDLGTAFSEPTGVASASYAGSASPTYGTGSLSVTGAKLIDVGNLSLQGIGNTSLATAGGGDIRGSGTLDVSGNLTLTAGQIYPPTAEIFNIAAYDPTLNGSPVLGSNGSALLGTITINRTGTPQQVPLSAGGSLNVYASDIVQDGVLRAPLGTVNLGLDTTTSSPSVDPITGISFPSTQSLILGKGSFTSVSTVSLATGEALTLAIPYGNNLNGTNWIDPTGADITVNGPVAKQVIISATTIADQTGSTVDLAGGGDLLAYRFVSGVTGTVDILGATSGSFAIVPGYDAPFSPYAAFNTSSTATNLGGDPGYVSQASGYAVGSSLYVNLGAGAGPQTYTLLPARYALLPGAYLVTPVSGTATGTVVQPDGSSYVQGYAYNALDAGRTVQPVFTMWDLATNAEVLKRADFQTYSANSFFPTSAAAAGVTTPRLPEDAGQLVLAAGSSMSLGGTINALAATNSSGATIGLGGLVDIASPGEILIDGPNTNLSAATNDLVLSSSELSAFGSASLLVGGYRTFTTTGANVTVTADNVIVDNGPGVDSSGNVILNSAGAPTQPGSVLSGSDIILAGNRNVVVLSNSTIEATGSLANGAEKLNVSDALTLNPLGETVTFAKGGVPLAFPQGATFTLGSDATGSYAAPGSTTTQTVAAGASVTVAPGGTFTLGTVNPAVGATLTFSSYTGSETMVSGDGALLRVSIDPNAQITRSNVGLSSLTGTGAFAGVTGGPGTEILSGATLSGNAGSVILDGTGQTGILTLNAVYGPSILSSATAGGGPYLSGKAFTFDSSGISLTFDGSSGTSGSLVLPVAALQSLISPAAGTTATTSISLFSYSSIDIYSTGVTAGVLGGTGLSNLALHAAQIDNIGGGSVTLQATNVQIDNQPNGISLGSQSLTPGGSLTINASGATSGTGTLQIGSSTAANPVNVELFSSVNLIAGAGVDLVGTGGLNVSATGGTGGSVASLAVTTPVVTTAAGSAQTLSADGALALTSSGSVGSAAPTPGLGGSLTLVGSSVAENTEVRLPSGSVALHATAGDVDVGGTVDVSGSAHTLNNLVEYTGGGQISITSDTGAVNLGSTGVLNVSAPLDSATSNGSRVGNAGTVSISAANVSAGLFTVSGTLLGNGGYTTSSDVGATPGEGGSFTLDIGSLPNIGTNPSSPDPSLAPLAAQLAAGGFNNVDTFRVRSGNVVLDGPATAHTFSLEADAGSITVSGTIDASGSEGGTLNVPGKPSDFFGNVGGAITLAASGSVVLESGSALTVAGANFNAAGRGGSVALDAGSSTNGVAPTTNDTRSSSTGAFQKTTTPVVDVQTGSTIDLSVAAATVALSAGEAYTIPEGVGDVVTVSSAGSYTTPGSSGTSFQPGTYTIGSPGTVITLSSAGQLTFLTNAAAGTATGTLTLRAPQTLPGTGMTPTPPDVQINPINGTLVYPSSILVEGYKVFTPIDGYIDSVEVPVNLNGLSFASAPNTQSILGHLTANWGASLNPLISLQTGTQLHVRPGAEIDSTVSTTTVTYTAPGSTSTLSVPAGGSFTIEDSTPSGQTASTDTLTFSSASTLVPVDAGSYSVAYSLSSSTTSLAVGASTSVVLGGAAASGTLSSTVGGVVTSSGTSTAFAAGSLPALSSGSTLTFTGAGSLSSTATTAVSVTATTAFAAHSTVNLPANSTVVLGTDGATASFASAGTVTWVGEPSLAAATFAVQVPAATQVTLPSTSTADDLLFGSAATLMPTSSGTYQQTFALASGNPDIPFQASTTIVVNGAIPSNKVLTTTGGTVTFDGVSTSFAPNASLPAMASGSTITFSGSGFLSSGSVSTNPTLVATTPFTSGSSVSVPADSLVSLGGHGATVTFPGGGLLSSYGATSSATNTLALTLPSGTSTTVTLPSTTANGASTTELVTVNAAASLIAIDPGSFTSSVQLSTGNPTFAIPASTSLVSTGTVAQGSLTSSLPGAVTLNGVTTTFAANATLPALSKGSVVTFAGSGGTLTASSTASFTATETFTAGSMVALPANSTATLDTNGATLTFSNGGTLTAVSAATSASNQLVAQVPAGEVYAVGSAGVVASSTGSGLTLNAPTSKVAGGSVTLPAGEAFFLPTGTQSAGTSGGYGTVFSTDTIQVGSSAPAGGATTTVTIDSTQGAVLSFVNLGSGTVTTTKGGIQTYQTTLDSSGITLTDGGSLSFGTGGQVTASAGGSILVPITSLNSGGIVIPAAGGSVTVSSNVAAGTILATTGGTITYNGTVTSFNPSGGVATLPALSKGAVITLAGGSLEISGSSGVTNIPVVTTNVLPANTPTTLASADVVSFTAGSVSVASAGGMIPQVTVNNNLLPGAASPYNSGDVIQLASTADRVTVVGTSPFTVQSPGALTLAFAASNTTSSTISLIAGNGPLQSAVAGSVYTTSGSTAPLVGTPGSLTLASNWDLSTYRYGPNVNASAPGSGEPGDLTLRAAANLVLSPLASLSDGFMPSGSATTSTSLWQATLLPAGSQSWSYTLVSGADLSAASTLAVLPESDLTLTGGSVLVGLGTTALASSPSTVTRTATIPLYYQTVRTGTGDISVESGQDVQLLDPLATIYTAGTQVFNPNSVSSASDFDTPNTFYNKAPGGAGALQNYLLNGLYYDYPAQYSFGGGDVTISAQGNIAHYVGSGSSQTASATAEMPTNWLYRRGYVGSTGDFGTIQTKDPNTNGVGTTSETASTTWWVDFSNFFEGVGTLGGGNVTLEARASVTNVDAVAATNARTTKFVTSASGQVDSLAADQVVSELGGGNVSVLAGGNISGGTYYVERGVGVLNAGGSIETNAARTTLNTSNIKSFTPDPSTWLPTTLFLGDGSFYVSAGSSVELGSVTSPFLMPQGINNSYYQTTYFSTQAPSDGVYVSSLQGDVTLKGSTSVGYQGSLYGWYEDVLYDASGNLASRSEPWLRLNTYGGNQLLNASFETAASVAPATFEVTAFSGDINLEENLNVSPSASGSLRLLASGSINGLQPTTLVNFSTQEGSANPYVWTSSTVDFSDADPSRIPGTLSPTGYVIAPSLLAPSPVAAVLQNFVPLFEESGAITGTNVVLQTELALHGSNPDYTSASGSDALHGNDSQSNYIYAGSGDISGFTLYSAKSTQVVAGQDITDVGLYIQNAQSGSVSVISAGRDIIASDPNSPLLTLSATENPSTTTLAQSGDIQISGPGSLEVLAGRNLELGQSTNAQLGSQGLPYGITSIGNTRNPYLPFAGANVVVGAGLGSATSLAGSQLDFATFNADFLNPATAGSNAVRYLPDLGILLDTASGSTDAQIWAAFQQLPSEQQDLLALNIFYDVLRDAGRDHNTSTSAGYGNFNNGYTALAALFGAQLDYSNASGTGFVDQFLNPTTGATNAATYLPVLGKLIGDPSTDTNAQIWAQYNALPASQQHTYAEQVFAQVLVNGTAETIASPSSTAGSTLMTQAVDALFTGQLWQGNILMDSRNVETTNGGDISVVAPGGALSLGSNLASSNASPPGIITAHGGNISIVTDQDVDVGVQRIFTLFGGNEIIWSTNGNIAAGASSKTVQSAPPTEVLVDPQSANVETDLAGLATGGGIGVLATLAGVTPGNVDLIAPVGAIDAGLAGIRASGNLNLAARVVLNAFNISVSGTVVGAPQAPAAPNLAPLAAGANASAAAATAANEVTQQNAPPPQQTEIPSVITVEVLGYGGDEDDDDTPNGSP